MIEKICICCASVFYIRNYRAQSAKYCSYICSGKHRKNIQYADKNNFVSIKCTVCDKDHLVLNKSKYLRKKSCSKECQAILMKKALGLAKEIQLRNLRNKEKVVFYKNCSICGTPFKLKRSSSRTNSCSKKCSMILSIKNQKQIISEEELRKTINSATSLHGLCTDLMFSIYTLYKLCKKYNIEYPNFTKNKLRSDGYYGYNNKNNHRNIYESFIERKLTRNESVHHIDCDKSNNNISNLDLLSSRSIHQKSHGSLERAAADLFRLGYITYSRTSKMYSSEIIDIKDLINKEVSQQLLIL